MDITPEEKEKLNKYLMRAYDNLSRVERMLKKGSDSDGERTEPYVNTRSQLEKNS